MKILNYYRMIISIIIFAMSFPAFSNGLFKYSRINAIDNEAKIIEFVESESVLLIERLNHTIKIPEDIKFIFGANDGPLYDPEEKQILMPDEFTYEVMDRFIDAKYVKTEEDLYNVTMDVVEHTLYHELAHALIDTLKIPVTGKEEDTADNLATILVIHTNESGSDIALSAADYFDLEGEDIDEFTDEDFWGEHSLDFQRFYNTICLIYGSNPNQYQDFIVELEIDENRAQLCIDDYQRQNESWKKLLKPYLKDNSLLN